MAITASDIHNQSFSIDRKGYDVDEVDVFLEHVANEIDLLNNQIASLESQLEAYQSGDIEISEEGAEFEAAAETSILSPTPSVDVSEYEKSIAEKDEIIADLNRQLDEKRANDSAISQALIIAQRSADEIVSKANTQANDTIQDAHDEAARILNRANSDKQVVIDSIHQLEDDREDAREEYSDLLRDFIADATRKLADIGGGAASVVTASHASQNVGGDVANGDEFEIDEDSDSAADYTTPQATDTVVAAAAPVASTYEKDLSGFGEADDFEFEEID